MTANETVFLSQIKGVESKEADTFDLHLLHLFLSDLEWIVMLPILLQQFRLFYAKDRPIGVALWAYVSDDVQERLAQGSTRRAPNDWKSGDNLWLAELIAPFGEQDEMVGDLKAKVFADAQVKFLFTKDGKREVKSV